MCSVIPRLVTLAVLCVHLMHISSGQLEPVGDKRSGARYCGRYLVQALQVVCNGVYNSPFIPKAKKSNGDLIPADFMDPEAEGEGGFWLRNSDLEGLTFPFRPKPLGRDLVPESYRRVSRGVHDECCRNSCTFQQLQMYCGRR
ncbi:LIRP-like [Hetaerina americana]|uniref:LIRP-like n=1 Tax=Hetaerina americana TaxID=62018 RepID=UPI003A7F4A32